MLDLVYLMLSAYCANMAASFARLWHGWNRPIHRALFGVLAFTFIADIVVDHVAYWLRIRESPW